MLKKGSDRPLRAANWRSSAPSSVCPASGHHHSERRSCDSGRQHVKQRFTYSGFPGCRGARHPGCSAHDSASFAHGTVSTTCSKALNTGRSLASHAYLTISRDSSVPIESARRTESHLELIRFSSVNMQLSLTGCFRREYV